MRWMKATAPILQAGSAPRVALDARERCQVNANGWSGRGGFAELELAKVSREWNTGRSGAQFSGIASAFS